MTSDTRSDLVRLAALGYELKIDTAALSRLHYAKEPQHLCEVECNILIRHLEREKKNRA
jgi:hypothetical protein